VVGRLGFRCCGRRSSGCRLPRSRHSLGRWPTGHFLGEIRKQSPPSTLALDGQEQGAAWAATAHPRYRYEAGPIVPRRSGALSQSTCKAAADAGDACMRTGRMIGQSAAGGPNGRTCLLVRRADTRQAPAVSVAGRRCVAGVRCRGRCRRRRGRMLGGRCFDVRVGLPFVGTGLLCAPEAAEVGDLDSG
jgi:hypothetical protein